MKGETEIYLEPGTKDGTFVTIKGHGMPNLPPNQTQFGNHILEIKIQVPVDLSEEQRRLIQQF